MSHRITNFDELNTGALREKALTIAESAYAAIDTDAAIRAKISFEGMTLVVDGRSYDLSWFRRIRVIGFGKVSCAAAMTIESLLRGHITSGVVIDVRPGVCDVIEIAQGTHPKPSPENLAVSKRVVDMAQDSDERDLVIVIVSGGGSSLLCWPAEECTLSMRLYDDLLKTGATIEEMNTVRKHISDVKGGGLAKMLHPATVVGLVCGASLATTRSAGANGNDGTPRKARRVALSASRARTTNRPLWRITSHVRGPARRISGGPS